MTPGQRIEGVLVDDRGKLYIRGEGNIGACLPRQASNPAERSRDLTDYFLNLDIPSGD